MARIFLVEDDPKLRGELKLLLEKYGYHCDTSDDFWHMEESVLAARPDLVLLDVNLPVYDGYHLCRELRRKSQMPIIIVTSRDSEMDELMGMNLGADDFVAKPYNTQILLARIAALLKRAGGGAGTSVSHRGMSLELSKSQAEYNGQQVELSKNEARILYLLMCNSGCIISRSELMNELWQSDEFIDDNTLTVNMNRLRKKLESIGVEDYLVTRRGQGYMV